MNNITTTQENVIIINRVSGKVTAEDIMNYVRKNVDHWIGKPLIWDFSKVNFSEISTYEWRSMVTKIGLLSMKKKGEKTAFVSSKDLPFGMLRMFEILAENAELAIKFNSFRDIEEAKKWLKEGDLP